MKKEGMSRTINFILIIAGGIIAIATENEGPYGVYIIILGALMLMIGLYRVSRNIKPRTFTEPTEEEHILGDDFDESIHLKEDKDSTKTN